MASAVKRKRESRSPDPPPRPPTGHQLRTINDAADLYRSTSFKLQIDALLPNVSPKYHLSQPLDSFLLALHNLLMSIKPITPQHPLHASRALAKRGIAVPYVRPLPTEETNWKVAFEPPTEIVLAGSWPTRTAVKAKDAISYSVDVAIAMPPSLFQEKDYLNGRLFQKRAYYLSVVASAIVTAKDLPCQIFYASTSDDPRCTTLVLRPESPPGKINAQIRIIPFLSQSPISIQRLSPSRSNLRTGLSHAVNAKEEPTPIYNSLLMLMSTPKAHLLSIHALIQDVPAFTDALSLLRVWANQRGYGLGSRMCVWGFEGKGMWWASLLELLVHGEEQRPMTPGKPERKRKPLGKGLSSYQLFRAAVDFLAKHSFSEEPTFVKAKNGHTFPPETYGSHDAIFVDSTSSVNLLAGVPLSSLDMLRHDAQATLETLDISSTSEDPFHTVFLQDHRDLFSRFDVVARLDISSTKTLDPITPLAADYGSVYNALVATLNSVLRRGLGNRAKAVVVLHPSSTVRPLSQALPASSSVIYLGVVLDTEHAFRLVDHGPAAGDQESQQAKMFRDFWGEKAELRRFKDGSITETVVWDVSSVDERTYVPSMIIKHLLLRHFGIGEDAVQTWQTQFDALLKVPESVRSLFETHHASLGYKAALSAFDGLVRHIKAIDDGLPLAVLNVSPVSPTLRYTEVFIPAAVPLTSRGGLPASASYLPVMEVIIEFEKSARWPDDLCAIQKVKLAFFEHLSSCLMNVVQGLRASVVLGDKTHRWGFPDEAALDIVTPEGWAFRIRICHDREATLLKEAVDLPPNSWEHHIRRFIHAPRHHRAIATLSHRFSAFAGTVRLTKRWFASHWVLGCHVSEEAVELLCAYVFLRTGVRATVGSSSVSPAGLPGTKERGFAQVLQLLKAWDWTKGLQVPLDYGERDTSAPTVSMLPSRNAAWSLVTEFDPEGHMWTSSGPNAVVARRISAIAKATWDALCSLESGDTNVKRLFQHPADDYHLVVELNSAILPRYYQNVDADSSVWTTKSKSTNNAAMDLASFTLAGFDLASGLSDDIKAVYEDCALIFYNAIGGTRIGVVWLPNVISPRPFRVLGGFSSIPVVKENEKGKEKNLVVLNQEAVAAEIRRFGSGLVSKLSWSVVQ